MSRKIPLPSKEILDELLHADFQTGKLYWKKRDSKWFKEVRRANAWNAKFSGKEALNSLSNGYKSGSILLQRIQSP